ncbi:phage tail tube protein [Paraburkholderia sp. DGU8]|uniref:phage tail tube protein n=1 Tax=Paraburkholderia sp. DGU8 TaxID=3161997 RepID=UPI0034660F72
MSKLTRKTLILAVIETVVGTDAVPTAALNAILARNCTYTPTAEFASRDVMRPYLGNSEQLPTAIHGQLDFEIELAGAGAAGTAPAWGALIQACGFSETITAGDNVKYEPISDNLPTVTLYYYLDGLFHKLTSGRGTVAFDMTAKSIPVMKFKFTGLYSDVVDQAMPAGVDYTHFQKPLVVNKANTPNWSFQGASSPLQALSIDVANSVNYRNLVKQESVDITDRKPAGSATIQLDSVATKDWWAAVRDAVTGPLTITHGKTAGNIIQIDGPAVQATNPAYSDQNGTAMLGLNLTFVPVTGNDEIVITVK